MAGSRSLLRASAVCQSKSRVLRDADASPQSKVVRPWDLDPCTPSGFRRFEVGRASACAARYWSWCVVLCLSRNRRDQATVVSL